MERLLREAVEALQPSNARKFDGDNNYKKRIELKICMVGADDGSPVFALEARSPRSAVNNLGLSVEWITNAPGEAADFLRKLADKITDASPTEVDCVGVAAGEDHCPGCCGMMRPGASST